MSIDELLQTVCDVRWAPVPNAVHVVASTTAPPDELVTAVEVLAFADTRLLLTDVRTRGWDLPGGHREPGESTISTARRECEEETGATLGSLRPVGHYRIELLGDPLADHRYPWPTSYIGILGGDVLKMTGVSAHGDCARGELCSAAEVEARSSGLAWFPLYRREAARRG